MFSNTECLGSHVKIHQIWLWQDRSHYFGVGIFSTLVAGAETRFIRPTVMGKGEQKGSDLQFSWQHEGVSGTARVAFADGGLELSLDQDLNETGRNLEDADNLSLKPDGVFNDERIALAPLTSGDAWRHWFENVLVGHFTSGKVPDC